jgi:hypothetical protein
MTREEALEVIKAYKKRLTNSVSNQLNGDIEAFDMAIQVLSQEPSGDLISRQELLEDLYKRDYTKFTHRDFVALVQYQDTVQQEPKTGRWMPTYGNVKCSVCGSVKESRRVGKATHYCDFCGARMVEPQESEEQE